MSQIVQSVIFNKYKYNLNECINYLTLNDYKVNKVDETKNYLRFRQYNPDKLKKNGYNNYYEKEVEQGILYVIAYKSHNKSNYV
jgi:hypothetical protein